MLKILQARLQQYVNQELSDVQVGFRKGRGSRDQIANIHWIIEKAREFHKNIYFCLLTSQGCDCVDRNKPWKILKETGPPYLSPVKPAYGFLRRQVRWFGILISWRWLGIYLWLGICHQFWIFLSQYLLNIASIQFSFLYCLSVFLFLSIFQFNLV